MPANVTIARRTSLAVAALGLGAAAVSLAILGPDNFILPAMVAICVMLAALRGRLAKEVAG